MLDGLYTARGWQPLPFCEKEYSDTLQKRRPSLVWGALCMGIALIGMVLSGFISCKNSAGDAA